MADDYSKYVDQFNQVFALQESMIKLIEIFDKLDKGDRAFALSGLLARAFKWDETSQSYDYWIQVHKSLAEIAVAEIDKKLETIEKAKLEKKKVLLRLTKD